MRPDNLMVAVTVNGAVSAVQYIVQSGDEVCVCVCVCVCDVIHGHKQSLTTRCN